MDIILTPDQAKFLVNTAYGKYCFEGPITKRVLAAIPESGRNYRPDANARTAIELANHIVTSDKWFLQSLLDGAFSWGGEEKIPEGATFASLAEDYEKSTKELFEKVKALPAEKLTQQVSFFGFLNNSAATYLGLASDHLIHHRGQLSAYVRAAGGKVPNIYGGSFDEPMQG
jgi:uncharacterized damage-inducible protein DinB